MGRLPGKSLVSFRGLLKAAGSIAGISLLMKIFSPMRRYKLRQIPGTRYKPFIGDGIELLREDLTPWVDKMCARFKDKPLFKVWVGDTPVIIVRDPKVGQELLAALPERVDFSPVTWAPKDDRLPIENIMVFANGATWSKTRKATEESVAHAAALTAHVPGMLNYVDRLVQAFARSAGPHSVTNVQALCLAMAQDAIAQAVFGLDMHSTEPLCQPGDAVCVIGNAARMLAAKARARDAPLLPARGIEDGWWEMFPVDSPEFSKRLMSSAVALSSGVVAAAPAAQYMCLAVPLFTPLWRLLARVLPDANARLQLKMIRGIRYGSMKLVDQYKSQQADGVQGSASDSARPLGIMPYILSQAGKEGVEPFSEAELLGTVIGALFGGFETTGNTLSLSLYHLAKNPEAQAKAQQEVDQVLGGKVAGQKELKDLPYLNGVVMETLRLSTTAPFSNRKLHQDNVHPSGAFRLPKGSTTWFPLQVYHRDPSIWPRPDEFLPERHIQPGHEGLAPTPPDLFFPFGVGARRCPGFRFAVLAARLALAQLLQHFEFRIVEGQPEPKMTTNITRIVDNVTLQVTTRSQPQQQQLA